MKEKTGNIRIIEARSRNHCCRGKAISITYSNHVFLALVIKHTTRMRRVLLPSAASPAPQIFFSPHYLIKETILGKELLKENVCFNFLYNFV